MNASFSRIRAAVPGQLTSRLSTCKRINQQCKETSIYQTVRQLSETVTYVRQIILSRGAAFSFVHRLRLVAPVRMFTRPTSAKEVMFSLLLVDLFVSRITQQLLH